MSAHISFQKFFFHPAPSNDHISKQIRIQVTETFVQYFWNSSNYYEKYMEQEPVKARIESTKCGFPLAEERKKRKTFFSHAAGSLGTGVRGVSRHVAHVGFSFCFAIRQTCPTHPPIKYL